MILSSIDKRKTNKYTNTIIHRPPTLQVEQGSSGWQILPLCVPKFRHPIFTSWNPMNCNSKSLSVLILEYTDLLAPRESYRRHSLDLENLTLHLMQLITHSVDLFTKSLKLKNHVPIRNDLLRKKRRLKIPDFSYTLTTSIG